jgi:hypothetical protein
MSFLGRLGSGISRIGALAGAALKPLGAIAKPVAGAVGAVANAFLPSGVANVIGNVANKAADFVSSGRAEQIASKIGAAGMALSGVRSLMPQGV